MKLLLAPVIEYMKKKGQPLASKQISYYSEIDRMDVFVGNDPIDEGFSIPFEDLEMNQESRKQALLGTNTLRILLKVKDPNNTNSSLDLNRKSSGLTINT